MDSICKICNREFSESSHFWKEHRIKQSSYYEKYYPKNDLFTKEKINFKSVEQYESTDFNDKKNLKKYLESISKDEGVKYLKNWLSKRVLVKGLVFAPSQFELRTLNYPSIKYFHKYYGEKSYEDLCSEVGLINRFDYNQKIEFDNKELKIIIDTREQNIINFHGKKEIKKLNFGDYSCNNNLHNIYIERKSLQDFLGSFSAGFDRLCREMERAQLENAYIIILLESKISNLLGIEHLKYLHTKASVDFILKKCRDLLLKYPNVQICCVDGRVSAANFIEKIFNLKNDPKTLDFQYLVDCKKMEV